MYAHICPTAIRRRRPPAAAAAAGHSDDGSDSDSVTDSESEDESESESEDEAVLARQSDAPPRHAIMSVQHVIQVRVGMIAHQICAHQIYVGQIPVVHGLNGPMSLRAHRAEQSAERGRAGGEGRRGGGAVCG
eukprot:COSAG05_NODE_57_length_23291_cov_75.862668_26_plen_133_part_00